MNHPTNEVDELYELALEAIACDDYEQAVIFLRKALEIAPLRKDIRRALADTLAQNRGSESLDHPGYSPPPAPPPARRKLSSSGAVISAAATVAAAESTPSKSLWVRPQPAARPAPAPSTAPRSYAGTHGSLSLALDDDDDDLDLPDMPDETPTRSDSTAAARKASASKKEKRVAGTKDFEDFLADMIESLGTLFTPRNRYRLLHGSAYATVIAFIGTACYQANMEFGTDLEATASRREVVVAEKRSPAAPRLLLSGTGLSDAGRQPIAPAIDEAEAELLDEARGLVNRQQYEAAITRLTPALQSGKRTPGREEIRALLAEAYDSKATTELTMGRIDNAIEAYREAVKMLPGDYNYRLHLANALYHLGSSKDGRDQKSLNEAIRIATDLIKADSTNVNAHQVHARTQQMAGKKAEAARAWNQVLKLAPEGTKAAREAQDQLRKLPKVS